MLEQEAVALQRGSPNGQCMRGRWSGHRPLQVAWVSGAGGSENCVLGCGHCRGLEVVKSVHALLGPP